MAISRSGTGARLSARRRGRRPVPARSRRPCRASPAHFRTTPRAAATADARMADGAGADPRDGRLDGERRSRHQTERSRASDDGDAPRARPRRPGLLGCRILGAVTVGLFAVGGAHPRGRVARHALRRAGADRAGRRDRRPRRRLLAGRVARLRVLHRLVRRHAPPSPGARAAPRPLRRHAPVGPSEPEIRARLRARAGHPARGDPHGDRRQHDPRGGRQGRPPRSGRAAAVHPARERAAPSGPRPRGVRARRASRSTPAPAQEISLDAQTSPAGAPGRGSGSSPRSSSGALYYRLQGYV